MDEQYPHWTSHVEWLSAHRGQAVQLHCSRCRLVKAYRVDDALKRVGDVSVKSFPSLVARRLGCKRVDCLDKWQSCNMAYFVLGAFTDLPDPNAPKPVRLPIGTYRLDDVPLADVPEFYGVSGFCPCGWRRPVDVRRLAIMYPGITTAKANALLRCRRCKNTRGNFLAYRFAPR